MPRSPIPPTFPLFPPRGLGGGMSRGGGGGGGGPEKVSPSMPPALGDDPQLEVGSSSERLPRQPSDDHSRHGGSGMRGGGARGARARARAGAAGETRGPLRAPSAAGAPRPPSLSLSLSLPRPGVGGGREGTGWTPGPRRSDPGRWRRRPGPHGPVRVVYRLRPITFSCSWLRKFPVTLAPLHELLHLRLVLVPAGNSRARRRGRDWARPAGPRRSPPLPAAPGSTLLLRRVVPAGGGSAGRGGSFSGRGRPAARRRRRRDWGWGAGGGPLPRSFLPRSSRSALTCARARAQGRRSRRGTASSSRGGRARGGRGRRPRCRRT